MRMGIMYTDTYIQKCKIQLAEVISKNLRFRISANELFKYIEKINSSHILIDFNNVQTITRSFAHQYLVNKSISQKNITEINISPTIKKMFEIVNNNTK